MADRSLLARLARPESLIFVCLWLLLMVGGRSKLFRDPGTFWHTRFGVQMLETGELVRDDPYSYTARQFFPDEHWFPHQWLGEWLMALVHRFAGWDSLLLATVTILAALYTWLAYRLMRAGLHWVLAVVLIVLTLAAGSSHFHVRPHLATMVFVALTFAWLCDFEMGRITARHLFWLVPVYVLWTNLHGGMLGGLATMILALAGWVGFKIVRLESPITGWKDTGIIAVVIIACGLTALANPYGLEMPRTWLKIMRSPHLGEIIMEHRPLNPREPDGQTVLVLAAAYLLTLAGLRSWRQVRVTWLLPLVWLYLAWSRIRHASLFSFTACLAITDIFPHTRWAEALISRGSDLFVLPQSPTAPRRAALIAWLLPVALVLAAIITQMQGRDVPVIGKGWVALDPELWPGGNVVKTLRTYPSGTRIFNEMNLGGFLMYFTPDLRIFVDDRCELYGDRFLLEYVQADRQPGLLEDWRTQFGFELALVQRDSPLDVYLSNPAHGWKLVDECPATRLYRHSESEPVGVSR